MPVSQGFRLGKRLAQLSQSLTDDGTVVAGSVFDTSVQTLVSSSTSLTVQLNQAGTLEVLAGTVRWYAPQAITITSVKCVVGTAPTGASLNVTLNKNGSSLNTISISASSTSSENTGLSLSLVEDDYLTVDITQIGSTVAGSDLNVIVEYTKD